MEPNTVQSQDYVDYLIHLIFGTIVAFLFFSQFERFLTMIFVLNFSTAGPNVTVVLVFLLLTGVVEVFLPWPHKERTLSFCLVASALMVIASFIPITLLATFAAILAMMFITPVLVNRVQLDKEEFTLSLIMAIVIHVITRSWLDTASYYATTLGTVLLLLWISIGVILWFVKIKNDPKLLDSSQTSFIGVAPVIGFMLIQLLFLAFPNVVSTWFIRNYFLISITGIIGLSVGALIIFEKGEQILKDKMVLVWIALFLLSLIDLLWINFLPFITYFTAQVSTCVILYAGLSKSTIRSPKVVGLRLTIVQLLMVVIIFLHVCAGNWAFMPSFLAFTRGHAATTIFIAGLFLPLSSLKFDFPSIKIERPQNLLNSIRIILLVVVVVSMAGVIVNDLLAVNTSPDSSRLKIMTFNIHQYFSEGQTGLYNLEQVRDVIQESGADVVGLEESEGARISSSNMNGVLWLSHQTGMKYYYYGPPTSAQIYGVSLLSRFPISSAQYVNLPAEESIERVAIVVEIDTGEVAGELPIIVTHFQTSRYSVDRYNQAETIVELAQDFSKAIILGDFNTRPDNNDPTYELLNSTFSDAWLLSGNPSSEGTNYRIDYIWSFPKGSWDVLNYMTLGSPRVSDHPAVYAELVVV